MAATTLRVSTVAVSQRRRCQATYPEKSTAFEFGPFQRTALPNPPISMSTTTDSVLLHRQAQFQAEGHATWNSPRYCTLLKEEEVRRTPVMGLRGEARRLNYIKQRRIVRNQSVMSRRSVHRGRRPAGWFRAKSRTPSKTSVREKQPTTSGHGVVWAKTIINRLSFNKLFKKSA
ncbi:hypothetical protein Q1695_004431 [Nippostrongylus brasiliensis]|nr:hypothetical protein Q1695_004431 [Nippostrongylus brasiliensis]